MNNEYHELVNRKKILNSEIDGLNRYLSPIRYFIYERGKYFKKDDSIKALSIIQEDLNKLELILDEKEKEREEISRTLTQNCNHPIVINKVCPICGEWFYQIPENASISIEIPSVSDSVSDYEITRALFTNVDRKYNNEYLNRIIETIKLAIQEEDTLSYFEESIEELQYDKNVKIRRLKR